MTARVYVSTDAAVHGALTQYSLGTYRKVGYNNKQQQLLVTLGIWTVSTSIPPLFTLAEPHPFIP